MVSSHLKVYPFGAKKTKIEKMIRKSKIGQQEILGFVMIIMIVVVVAVIFLGISLRKGDKELISTEDLEISNFLSSSLKYTSDCVVKEPFYGDLGEVIEGCYSGKSCSDGRTACEVANQTYSDMINSLWPAGAERPIKYTSLDIYYSETTEEGEGTRALSMLKLEQGEPNQCVIKRAGRQQIYNYPGNIIIEFSVCK